MKQVSLGEFVPELQEKPQAASVHTDCFKVIDGKIEHPYIVEKVVAHRAYQLSIAVKALEKDTLVVIPTGLGKTVIAALVAADVLHHGKGKVLFLAPTKPLAQQHMQSFGKMFPPLVSMGLFTGTTAAAKRKQLWDQMKVVFATPQGIMNDLENRNYDLYGVGLIIFDEAHRSVGDYAYVAISQAYHNQRPEHLILALTASPGSEKEKINEVMRNLGIDRVEARTEEDPDVAPYVQETDVVHRKVKLTTYMIRARRALEDALTDHTNRLKQFGFIRHRKKGDTISKKDILSAGKEIMARMNTQPGNKGALFGAMYHQAISLHVATCLELLETQGVEPTLSYMNRLRNQEKPKKSAKAFLNDANVVRAFDHLCSHRGVSHPKVDELMNVLKEQFDINKDSLVIVFSQFRDTISGLLEYVRAAGYAAERFVGQADRNGDAGMSQKEQAEMLDRFRKREFSVLLASQVGEEGIDIPAVDMVVFYEPIPSAVRSIQRRGRTGRNDVGRVVVLMTEDSRDEGFYYAEMGRESKMRKIVKRMASRRG